MGGKSSGSSGSQIMSQPSPYETALARIANEMFDKTSKLRDYSTRDLENFMNGGSFQGGNTGMGGYPTSQQMTVRKSNPTIGSGSPTLGGGGYYRNSDGSWSPTNEKSWYKDEFGNLYPGSGVTQGNTTNPGSTVLDMLTGKNTSPSYSFQGLPTQPDWLGYGAGFPSVQVTPTSDTPGSTLGGGYAEGANPYATGGVGGSTPGGLGSRFNPYELPAFKGLYDTARSGLEDQYNTAKQNILANTSRGGSMNRRLQDLEFNRATDVGSLVTQTATPLITDLYNKAYGTAWQTPESSMQGLSQAQQGYSSRLSAANQADQISNSRNASNMSSLGTLGTLGAKGLGAGAAGLISGGTTASLGTALGLGATGLLGLL